MLTVNFGWHLHTALSGRRQLLGDGVKLCKIKSKIRSRGNKHLFACSEGMPGLQTSAMRMDAGLWRAACGLATTGGAWGEWEQQLAGSSG